MNTDPVSIANMPFWGYLPMGTTNFGGDFQVFTIDPQSFAPIGCSLNFPAQCAVNGYYNQPLFNNFGINNPVGYNIYPGLGYYC